MNSKIRLLNKLLAASTQCPNEIFANAAEGVSMADKSDDEKVSTAVFAKNILRLYDPDAHAEVIEFGNGHFDPLFAIPEISLTARRLSGYKRAILVVSGLYDAKRKPRGKAALKRRREISGDVDFIEDCLSRYKTAIPNLEILFI